VLRNSLKINQV